MDFWKVASVLLLAGFISSMAYSHFDTDGPSYAEQALKMEQDQEDPELPP